VRDWFTADESQIGDARVTCEMAGGLGPAGNGLDKVWVVTASRQGGASDIGEVRGGPRRLLAILDDYGVAGE